MNIIFTARRTEIFPGLKERAQKKLDKLDRFFGTDASATVTLTQERERITSEITVNSKGFYYRAESTELDAIESFDEAYDNLVRQIVKNKQKLRGRMRIEDEMISAEYMPAPDYEEETEYHIVKSKRYPIKPMLVDEAILQMNMLGHAFFIFRNGETDEINVVYSRKSGNYGLIEPGEIVDDE